MNKLNRIVKLRAGREAPYGRTTRRLRAPTFENPLVGLALPVATVIENLEDLSVDEVIEQFDVTREQITAVLDFIAESLRAEPVATGGRPL